MERLQAAFGLFALLAIAAALSENRRAIDWRQAGFAFAASIAAAPDKSGSTVLSLVGNES
jgi:nucleoside permease NupC